MQASNLFSNALASRPQQYFPQRLPDSTGEFLFMGEAVEHLARAKYGADWTGEEPLAQLPEELPHALTPVPRNALWSVEPIDDSHEPAQWIDPPSRAVLERADDLLAKHRPDLQRPPRLVGLFSGLSPRPLNFKYSEWRIAQKLARAERDVSVFALSRWLDLQTEIVALCESGILETVVRPAEGGEFSAVLPKSHWRTETYAARFVFFKLNPEHPFKENSAPHELQWLFFKRTSMRRAIAQLRDDNTEEPGGDVYSTEFMDCMKRVISAMGITATNQPKKAAIEAEIPAHWRGSAPLSQASIKYMASFIRLEESRTARHRPKK